MPRATFNLSVNDVQGVREMLAGMVSVSTAVGLAAVAAAFALALPTYLMLFTYPVVCSLTLLLTAALWNIRVDQVQPVDQALRSRI